MLNKPNKLERKWVELIKSMNCGVCGALPPSHAHHIQQHKQYITIPLCEDCHTGAHNGIHGRKSIWKVMKKDEPSVLNDTIEKIFKQWDTNSI